MLSEFLHNFSDILVIIVSTLVNVLNDFSFGQVIRHDRKLFESTRLGFRVVVNFHKFPTGNNLSNS